MSHHMLQGNLFLGLKNENYGLDSNLIILAEIYQYGHSFLCVVMIISTLHNMNELILIRATYVHRAGVI
ncbi:Hypothetical predicted protein [Podarcis lilfordi]|uniref:Uncharacterized protein n=1 Tax=Podarcis lilfordi TaxID=74358 RepID=A0AA35P2L3_9SAUR|nr:Hypothetical predicted protein [Podarcis lilfordi]